MISLGFLASGNGSSLRAVVAAIAAGALDARAALVVSNRREAPALGFARARGIEALWIPTVPDAAAADARLARTLQAAGVDLVVLSGYLRKLGPVTLAAFEGRILNIHPALLPAFGGQGMYGRRVHEAVAAAGATQSGATVHLVDDQYDHGAVVAQQAVELPQGATPTQIEAAVTAIEPALFVRTLQAIATGAIRLPELEKAITSRSCA